MKKMRIKGNGIMKMCVVVGAMFFAFLNKVRVQAAMSVDEAMESLQQQDFFIGTQTALAVGTGAITLLAAGYTGFLFSKELALYQKAHDTDKAAHKKKYTSILITGVVILLAGSIVTYIFAIYGH